MRWSPAMACSTARLDASRPTSSGASIFGKTTKSPQRHGRQAGPDRDERQGDWRTGDRRVFGRNSSAQDIPVVKSQELGDQFQALAVGEGDRLFLESFAQRLRHSLSVAKIAHGATPVHKRKTDISACVADSFARAKEA